MISIIFYKSGGRLTGFCCSGHSGYSDAGSDIVCAAVTSAVRLCECTLNDVLKCSEPAVIREENAFIELRLKDKLSDESDFAAQSALRALYLLMDQFSVEYPENIVKITD